jgi:hypothetical protein
VDFLYKKQTSLRTTTIYEIPKLSNMFTTTGTSPDMTAAATTTATAAATCAVGSDGRAQRSDDDHGGHAQFTIMIDYSTFGTSVKENELLAKEGFHGSFHSTGFSLV